MGTHSLNHPKLVVDLVEVLDQLFEEWWHVTNGLLPATVFCGQPKASTGELDLSCLEIWQRLERERPEGESLSCDLYDAVSHLKMACGLKGLIYENSRCGHECPASVQPRTCGSCGGERSVYRVEQLMSERDPDLCAACAGWLGRVKPASSDLRARLLRKRLGA